MGSCVGIRSRWHAEPDARGRVAATVEKILSLLGEELGIGAGRISDPQGHGPAIWFQIVPDAKAVKNRLHLDIHVGGERTDPVDGRSRDLIYSAAYALRA
jgi:hypothetical protein